MSKFIKLLNNPIINHINPKLEQIEEIDSLIFNKQVKKTLKEYRKNKIKLSIFQADRFENLWIKD